MLYIGFCNSCKQDKKQIAITWTTKEVGFERYNGEGKTVRCCVECKNKFEAEAEEIVAEFSKSSD